MKASSFVWCMLALLSCLASATAFVCSPLADSARRHVQACGTEARLQRAGFGGAPDRCRQQQPPASRLLQPRASSASRTPARVPPMRMGGVGVPGGESLAEQEYEVPNGCRRLRIPTPLGLILEEVEDGNGAVVKGFTEGSNGQRLGVKIGETLVACSATSLKAGKEGAFSNTGYGGRPFDNWSIVMFPCENSPFKQILSAIISNNPRWGIKEVSLVLKPPA